MVQPGIETTEREKKFTQFSFIISIDRLPYKYICEQINTSEKKCFLTIILYDIFNCEFGQHIFEYLIYGGKNISLFKTFTLINTRENGYHSIPHICYIICKPISW